MATLVELLDNIKAHFGDNLIDLVELGTGDGGRRKNYKIYYKDGDMAKTDIIQILVFNEGTADEGAYFENRNLISTPPESISHKLQKIISKLIGKKVIKYGEVVSVNEMNEKAVIKVTDALGDIKHFLVSLNPDGTFSHEEINY